MKTKLIIIPVITCVCIFAATIANAQNPRPYPPLKTGATEDRKTDTNKKNAGAKAGSALSAKDKAFMMSAAKGGMMEVEWGKLAAKNGQNADVKKFGSRMVADHSKANNELMALAKKDGVSLPAAKSTGKWKSDKDYVDMMVKDHEKDLAEFQGEASGGTDADLKKFADNTSKVISKHLQMVKELQGKMK